MISYDDIYNETFLDRLKLIDNEQYETKKKLLENAKTFMDETIEEYNNLGEEFTIFDSIMKKDVLLKISNFNDEYFKNLITLLKNQISNNSGTILTLYYNIRWVELYELILMRRRSGKINKIKNNIKK